MSGFFLLRRGWRSNPAFQDEPCTEREAWVCLIEEAAYSARRKRVGKIVVDVERGQIAASTRFLADAWRWAHSKVRRYLDRLEREEMVSLATDQGLTIITLCNYEKHQSIEQDTDDEAGTAPAQGVKRSRSETGTPARRKPAQASHSKETENGVKRHSSGTASDTEAAQLRHSSGTNYNEGNKGNEGKDIPVADATEPAEPATAPPQPQQQAEMVLGGPDPTPGQPVDLKAVIFGACLVWLTGATGKPQDKLRPALGRLCSRYGDGAVLEVLQNAARASPVDPIAWIHDVIRRDYEEINGTGTYSRKREKLSPHQALFEAGALVDAQLREEKRIN
ncbi:hypothetical protein ABMY26_00725 (plasmid) [Azospirillum sp. HJ39]|uniref:hypothetical protein n=1 Tax=Azospirillum sp. HJ39 TaxID=3159496 RepID=UPI0035567DE4